MTSFEKYLIDIGYDVYHYDVKKSAYIQGYKYISTMVNLDNRYFPKGVTPSFESYNKYAFVIGLGQSGYPPHVIYPYTHKIHRAQVEMSNEDLFDLLNKYRR